MMFIRALIEGARKAAGKLASLVREKSHPPAGKKAAPSSEVIQALALLRPLTAASFLILSAVSAYLNYITIDDMMAAGMKLWQANTAAATVSIAVSAALVVFWAHIVGLVPIDQGWSKRRALLAVTMLGCGLVFLISSWMNASALIGVQAQEQELAGRLSAYREAIDEAHRRAIVVRQLAPFVQAEASRFAEMSKSERASGALTGSRSPGAVTATLDQVSGRLTSLAESIALALKEAGENAEKAHRHLKAMQDLLGGQGEFDKRLSAFAEHAVALDALLATLSEQSVLPAIRHTAGALGSGLVMAAPSMRSSALAERQTAVMEGINAAVRDIGDRLVSAASEIEAQTPVKMPPFKLLSRPDAALKYARDFLPAWGAAVSLDMMPLVIVLVQMIVRMNPAGQPSRPAAPRRKTAQPARQTSDPEDFEDWLERRPGGLAKRTGTKGDLS